MRHGIGGKLKKRYLLAGCSIAMMLAFTSCGKKEDSITYIMSDVQDGNHPTAMVYCPLHHGIKKQMAE